MTPLGNARHGGEPRFARNEPERAANEHVRLIEENGYKEGDTVMYRYVSLPPNRVEEWIAGCVILKINLKSGKLKIRMPANFLTTHKNEPEFRGNISPANIRKT